MSIYEDIIRPVQGTYVLILQARAGKQVQVGMWGSINITPGYYLYVGSAFGPGGLKARVGRHARLHKSKHWHIDYVREHMKLTGIWISYQQSKLEHDWARILFSIAGMEPVAGFGCSDCQCNAHLFRSLKRPDFKQFSNMAGGDILALNPENH